MFEEVGVMTEFSMSGNSLVVGEADLKHRFGVLYRGVLWESAGIDDLSSSFGVVLLFLEEEGRVISAGAFL